MGIQTRTGHKYSVNALLASFAGVLALVALLGWVGAEAIPTPAKKAAHKIVMVTVSFDTITNALTYKFAPASAAGPNPGDIKVNNGDKIQWKAVTPGNSNEIVVFVPDHAMNATSYAASDGAATSSGTVSAKALTQHKYSVQLFDKQTGNYYPSPDPKIMIGTGGEE